MSVNAKMTAIADKIRALLGISGPMGLDAMATNVGKAQDEVDEQSALIEQLRDSLASKTTGIVPAGIKVINANGMHDVTEYSGAQVNVPVGITPSGTKAITANGVYDVVEFSDAEVNVPIGITPSGTKAITENGTHDITEYANAEVNVPVGIFPSGTKTITANGTHDVTNYANALISVNSLPAGLSKMATGTIKYTSDTRVGGKAIAHNMGVAPDFYVVFPVSAIKTLNNDQGIWLDFASRTTVTTAGNVTRTCMRHIYWNTVSNGTVSSWEYRNIYVDAESIFYTDRFVMPAESEVCFKANITYRWIAGHFS